MTVAELNTLYTAAMASYDAADYDAAIRHAIAIKLRLASSPDKLWRSLAGGGNQGLSFANAEAIDSFISTCRALKAQVQAEASTSGPWQQTTVTYTRAS